MSTVELDSIPAFRQIVTDLLGIMRLHAKTAGEGWNGATTIEQAGIDSLELEELMVDVEDKYGVRVDFNRKRSEPDLATVDDIARFVQAAIRRDLAAR